MLLILQQASLQSLAVIAYEAVLPDDQTTQSATQTLMACYPDV